MSEPSYPVSLPCTLVFVFFFPGIAGYVGCQRLPCTVLQPKQATLSFSRVGHPDHFLFIKSHHSYPVVRSPQPKSHRLPWP
ncbi:hypothetical protein F4819DRAFT_480332 [Hypoxylon fuscum]|nr:hypothetical protein F4819DRAFT_480332 [Hypoxylon fuscum]